MPSLIPATSVLVACAASSIPFGIWVLATSRWPSWMSGAFKWPLGDHISGDVARLQGWSYVLVGGSALVLAVLLVVVPSVVTGPLLSLGWLVGVALAFCVLLLISGVVPYVWSVVLSYRR